MGKDQALIPDDQGNDDYQWVDQDDPRANEVRLFNEIGRTGEVGGGAGDNLLAVGDSADFLRGLLREPNLASEYANKVKLVYIDPPFNTHQAFDNYNDSLEHSVWLTMMRDRLVLIRDLLADDGSVWVHLDDEEMAYARVMMDEIFGRANFVATVVWQRTNSPRNSARHLSLDSDYILVFAKDVNRWEANLLARSAIMDSKFKNPDDDARGPWFASDLSARNFYSKGSYQVVTPNGRSHGPGAGRFWSVSEEKLAELDADNRVWWGKTGLNKPTRKLFLSEVKQGRVASSVWLPEEVGYVRNGKQETLALLGGNPFATPKPEKLLERVIAIATNPGDIVVDCFAGSGTTAAVAHKTGRRWATCELIEDTVVNFTEPRLKKVVGGEDDGGVSKTADWHGGGGFRTLVSEKSAYVVEAGKVFLAEWVKGEEFARMVASQLGFVTVSMDDQDVFAGVDKRRRLAVIDGTADDDAVSTIVSKLDEGETAVIVAKSLAPTALAKLRKLSPGSRLLKAPQDLLDRKVVR